MSQDVFVVVDHSSSKKNSKTTMSNTDTVTTLERLANLLRIHSIESTQEANSG